ncbi:MAG: hypothetical protein V1793_16825 [Pseudomonadota bacterium]
MAARTAYRILTLPLLVTLLFVVPASGFEIKTEYATITYESEDALRVFNNKLYLGKLKYMMKNQKNETVEDEVISKINLIVEKVETVLSMYPANLHFDITIHPTTDGVQQVFYDAYKKKVDYIAFYSPKRNTVFYSANNATLRVVSHEIGHVVAENYFAISPPPKIHEVLAQYAESHITD